MSYETNFHCVIYDVLTAITEDYSFGYMLLCILVKMYQKQVFLHLQERGFLYLNTEAAIHSKTLATI
jgi:hypothetical protein